jgi:hypothetical protein
MPQRSPENRATAKTFRVEDRASGRQWKPGLTWTGEAADRAVATARRLDPSGDWILREVSR